ncbi:hypothetical protein M0804_004393 [Polistes exclamans]|nr:hypothetical protein M0804_004393 [Polistes exclamans]
MLRCSKIDEYESEHLHFNEIENGKPQTPGGNDDDDDDNDNDDIVNDCRDSYLGRLKNYVNGLSLWLNKQLDKDKRRQRRVLEQSSRDGFEDLESVGPCPLSSFFVPFPLKLSRTPDASGHRDPPISSTVHPL